MNVSPEECHAVSLQQFKGVGLLAVKAPRKARQANDGK